jgi:hypothetical protein
MSDIGISMSTSVFGKIGLQGNINLNPYAIDENGRTINKFMILHNGNLARLTRAGASFSYAINGNGSTRGDTGGGAADAYTRIYYHPVTGEYIPGGYLYYMNANSPWSMNFNFNYSYQKNYQNSNGQLLTKHNHMMTIGFNGSVQLTNAFSMTLSSGFDVIKMRLSTTQLNAAYDLHCFNIQVSWVPTGTWQSWSFRIAANAAALQDILKFKKSSSYSDNSSFWE